MELKRQAALEFNYAAGETGLRGSSELRAIGEDSGIEEAEWGEVQIVEQVVEVRPNIDDCPLAQLELLAGREIHCEIARAAEAVPADSGRTVGLNVEISR